MTAINLKVLAWIQQEAFGRLMRLGAKAFCEANPAYTRH